MNNTTVINETMIESTAEESTNFWLGDGDANATATPALTDDFWNAHAPTTDDNWNFPNIPTSPPPPATDNFWYHQTPTFSPVSYYDCGDDWYHDDDEPGVDAIAIVITILIFIVLCVVAAVVRRGMTNNSNDNGGQSNGNTRTTARATLGAAPRATAPAEEKPADPELRAKVVKAIFPEQKVDDTSLQYDEEAQSLRWANNNEDGKEKKNLNTTCSICLDKFAEGDLIISSLCSHIYHRECVMEWAQTKDDCPMCRQKMWDEDTYNLLEANIKRLGKSCVVES